MLHDGKFKGKGLLTLMDPVHGLQAPRHLALSKNSMGKPIVAALADWEPLREVRVLDLTDVRLNADNLQRLLDSPHLRRGALRGQ